MSETIDVSKEETEYPTWVAGNACAERAWRENLAWRVQAQTDGKDSNAWRGILLQQAEAMYPDEKRM